MNIMIASCNPQVHCVKLITSKSEDICDVSRIWMFDSLFTSALKMIAFYRKKWCASQRFLLFGHCKGCWLICLCVLCVLVYLFYCFFVLRHYPSGLT